MAHIYITVKSTLMTEAWLNMCAVVWTGWFGWYSGEYYSSPLKNAYSQIWWLDANLQELKASWAEKTKQSYIPSIIKKKAEDGGCVLAREKQLFGGVWLWRTTIISYYKQHVSDGKQFVTLSKKTIFHHTIKMIQGQQVLTAVRLRKATSTYEAPQPLSAVSRDNVSEESFTAVAHHLKNKDALFVLHLNWTDTEPRPEGG